MKPKNAISLTEWNWKDKPDAAELNQTEQEAPDGIWHDLDTSFIDSFALVRGPDSKAFSNWLEENNEDAYDYLTWCQDGESIIWNEQTKEPEAHLRGGKVITWDKWIEEVDKRNNA